MLFIFFTTISLKTCFARFTCFANIFYLILGENKQISFYKGVIMKLNGIIPAGVLRKGLEKAQTQANNQPQKLVKPNKPSAIVDLENAKQNPKLSLDAVYTADGFINQASKRINKLEKMADDLHKLSRNNIKEGNETIKQEKEEKILQDPKILDVSKQSLDKFSEDAVKAIKQMPEVAIAAQANVSSLTANKILKT